MSSRRDWFGAGGGRSGGGGDGDRSPRHCRDLSEEERRKLVRLEAVKKRAARRWTNYGRSPPPSIRRYAPPEFCFRRPSPEHVSHAGEGSSRDLPPPSPTGSNDWSMPSPQRASAVQASESKAESPVQDAWERFYPKEKIMPKSNNEGSSRDSKRDTEHRLASKGFSSCRPVKLASPDETTHRCSLQHENNEVKYYSLSRRLRKQKQEKLDIAASYVRSTYSGDLTAKLNSSKLLNPKRHGKRSTRTRGKNSTLWAGVRVSDTAAAYSLLQTTLPPHKGKTNNVKFHPVIFSGLNLRAGAENFDLKSAKSALASLYGESKQDLCIEFAVKLLMDEIRLPKEAAEIEEFFNRKMNRENSSIGR